LKGSERAFRKRRRFVDDEEDTNAESGNSFRDSDQESDSSLENFIVDDNEPLSEHDELEPKLVIDEIFDDTEDEELANNQKNDRNRCNIMNDSDDFNDNSETNKGKMILPTPTRMLFCQVSSILYFVIKIVTVYFSCCVSCETDMDFVFRIEYHRCCIYNEGSLLNFCSISY
jgi:hypothetical protein